MTDNLPRKYRRVLTRPIRNVQSGKIRCIIVYSLCRLWRRVSICEALIDFFYDHNCLLYDRNGMVNFWTLEGRNTVIQNAVVSAYQREYCSVHCPKSVEKSRAKGKLVITGHVQGFLSKGGKTGEITHLYEEQAIVLWAFQMLDAGDGIGPLSTNELADRMMVDGKQL